MSGCTFPKGYAESLTALGAVVFLEVVYDSHVDVLTFVFVAVIALPELRKLFICDVLHICFLILNFVGVKKLILFLAWCQLL